MIDEQQAGGVRVFMERQRARMAARFMELREDLKVS